MKPIPVSIVHRARRRKSSRRRFIHIGPPGVAPVRARPPLVFHRRAKPARHRRQINVAPPACNVLTVNQQAAGFYRIDDGSIAQYELYIGTDTSPDFTASPASVSPTLPMSSPTLTAGHVYHLVLRQRDAWNLVSQNVSETIFDLAGDGTMNPTLPSAPASFTASAAAAGHIQVSASYLPLADGINAADTFLVYLTTDGSTPNPGSSSPVTTGVVLNADGTAKFSALVGPYTEGTVVKVLVRMRRTGSPNHDSPNTTPVSATATLLGPAAPIGVMSLGDIAE